LYFSWARRQKVRSRSLRFSAVTTLLASSVAVTLADEVARRPSAPRYPPVTRPVEVAKLIAPDARDGDEFGRSVAIHGATIVVGAPGEVTGTRSPSTGSAYVFEGPWRNRRCQQKLVASDYQDGASFGRSVAVWEDTIAVGAEHEDVPGVRNAGSVDVFVRTDDLWVPQQRLIPSDPGVENHYGHALAMRGDTLVVGTWGCNKVYIFKRTGTTWTELQKLHKPPPEGGNFGVSVALSDTTLVVGSESSDLAGYSRAGAAFVFEERDGSWEQTQELTASDPEADDRFGSSVAVFDDTIVVGAARDDHGSSVDSGSAYVFERSEDRWVESQKLISGTPATQQLFGSSVCVCRNNMMVGAPHDAPLGLDDAGCGYFYSRSAGSWAIVDSLWASDAAAENLFGEVAVHGRTAVVGARLADHSGLANPGAAYVYLLPSHVD
jgi:hypothetical protein